MDYEMATVTVVQIAWLFREQKEWTYAEADEGLVDHVEEKDIV